MKTNVSSVAVFCTDCTTCHYSRRYQPAVKLSMHTLLNCVPALQHTLDCHARLAGRCVAVSQSQILMSHWLKADHMTSGRNTFVPSPCTHATNPAIAISRICERLIASDLWWTLIPVYYFWCVLYVLPTCIRSSLCCILTFVLSDVWRLLRILLTATIGCGQKTLMTSQTLWILLAQVNGASVMAEAMLATEKLGSVRYAFAYGSHLYFVSSSLPSL